MPTTCRQQPVMSLAGIDQDYQIIGKPCVIDLGVLARGLLCPFQRPVTSVLSALHWKNCPRHLAPTKQHALAVYRLAIVHKSAGKQLARKLLDSLRVEPGELELSTPRCAICAALRAMYSPDVL
jgi:hypothetical protein